MPLILNIETSSTICSVCLAKDGKLVDFKEDKSGNSHARVLTVFIDELIKKNGIVLADLDAIAVSAGPGSYTGLRIGTSVAKGVCYALNKPLIAVPTLLSMAGEMLNRTGDQSAVYMPALDARRMDIYTAVYDADGNEILTTRAVTVDPGFENTLLHLGKIFMAGSGAAKCGQIFNSANINFIDSVECDARFLAPVSEARALAGIFESIAYFEPFYLKEFGAKT